jgi:steroid delta-isomerase-like uncharacterized protein
MKESNGMSTTNKLLMNSVIEELFNRKRIEMIPSFYAPGCRGLCPDGPFQCREEFQAFFERYWRAFPDFSLDINHMVVERDQAIVLYTFTGTNTECFLGYPATGRKIRVPGVLSSRIADGWICEQDFFWDGLGPRRQLWLASMADRQRPAFTAGSL